MPQAFAEDSTETSNQGTTTVATSRFGDMPVDPDKIITMTAPLLGFPAAKQFVLRPHGQDSPFLWLQALNDPQLAFVVIPAAFLFPGYRPVIGENIRRELEAASEEELETLLILTIPAANPQQMTANLLGPLMVNSGKRLARQVLQDPAAYDSCWPVFTEETG